MQSGKDTPRHGGVNEMLIYLVISVVFAGFYVVGLILLELFLEKENLK